MTTTTSKAEPTIEFSDSYEWPVGNAGDPRWPRQTTVRLFRRDEIGQRLLVDERTYVLVSDVDDE
jgi:hypothetical protein